MNKDTKPRRRRGSPTTANERADAPDIVSQHLERYRTKMADEAEVAEIPPSPQTTRRRRGRPIMPAADRKGGNNITFRPDDDLRERLENVATVTERSLSQEVTYRLNQSFIERDTIARAFGRENADLIKAIGIGLQIIEAKMKTRWGDPLIESELAVLFGKLVQDRIFNGAENWLQLLGDAAKQVEGPGALAADVALAVLSPSPRPTRNLPPLNI